MDAANFYVLGPEGDRLDALAALHGVAAAMALTIGRRVISRGAGRQVIRQGRVLGRLATALADAFIRGGQPGAAVIADITTLLAKTQVAERRGLPHERLVSLPLEWPLSGLPMTAPALGLYAVMRLRLALERHAVATADPKRLAQLAAIRELQAQLRAEQSRLDTGAIDAGTALRAVIAGFAAAESAIGDDLAALLGEAPAAPAALGTTILTAGYGREMPA